MFKLKFMKTHFLRKPVTTAFFVALTLFFACKKKEDVKPTDQAEDGKANPAPNPAPSPNTVIVDKKVFAKKSFSSNLQTSGHQEQGFINSNETKPSSIDLAIALPNSSPKTGSYKVVAYKDAFTTPSKGKVAIRLKNYPPEYDTYSSTLDTNTFVKVENQGDSIEVTFENIRLDTQKYKSSKDGSTVDLITTSVYVSAKYKIKTKPVPASFTAKATFTEGNASVLNYSFNSQSGNYNYDFTNPSFFNMSSVGFVFKEKLTSSKTYSIVSKSYPSNASEVAISLVTSQMVNYVPSEDGKKLTVTAKSDGSFEISFSNVNARGVDLQLKEYTNSLSGTATFKENIAD